MNQRINLIHIVAGQVLMMKYQGLLREWRTRMEEEQRSFVPIAALTWVMYLPVSSLLQKIPGIALIPFQ
jgi:uncharacterized membrane protein